MESSSQLQQATVQPGVAIDMEALREHWQGHRRLTRRMIESFPEDRLFTYAIGGMRPFSSMVIEMIALAGSGINGVVTGDWQSVDDLPHHQDTPAPTNREEILRIWDETTLLIDRLWPQIRAGRLQEVDLAFGQYEAPVHAIIFYWIDNEIHHRGQGYVYLRSLGIEPPPFWDRD